MSIKNLNPYLNFDGTAAEAIALYEKTLDAKSDPVMRFGDVPGIQSAPAHKERVMHARLHLGNGVIMISDGLAGQPPNPGNAVHVSLDFSDVDDMRKKFDALAAAGGKVTIPLADAFWGATFGMLVDKFGISWMFNCEKKRS